MEQIPEGVKFVKVPTLTSWTVVTAHPEVYQEVARAPDRMVSAQEGIEQVRSRSSNAPGLESDKTLSRSFTSSTQP